MTPSHCSRDRSEKSFHPEERTRGTRKWGLPDGDPAALPSYFPDTVSGARGAPQLYSHPTHWHARNLLRRVPVVRSIDPPGRKIPGHRPNLMIATTTLPHISCVPIGNREFSRSFLRGGTACVPPLLLMIERTSTRVKRQDV